MMSNKNVNIKNLVRPNILKLNPYSSARDEFKDFNHDMVFLDANENPNNTDVNRYPDPQQIKLKDALAAQRGVNINQILLGNGSDEVLDLIFRAFCEPNKDNVIILPPTYGMYQVLADVNSIQTKKVVLTEDFQPNVEEILRVANKDSKLLFICSPNNPTSNSFQAKKIERLIDEFNGIVVIDEAYIDFSEEEGFMSRLKDYPNLIVTQTLSKAYGMAGIRLGICYASAEVISILNKIKPPYNVNELTQQRALKRLEELDKVKGEVESILNERYKLEECLRNIRYIQNVYKSDANFILVKVDDATKRYNQLIERGIVVRNRDKQPLCKDCLRFTVGTKRENESLIEILNNL